MADKVGMDMNKEDTAELVEHIDTFGKKLSNWEVNFIGSLIDDPPDEYSDKQVEVIERIYDEKC